MASLPYESSAADHPVVASCSLPPADRAQRTADFRALFADAWISRTRTAIGVLWKLRATNATDAESRRLAALEARCCDGIRFDIARRAPTTHGGHPEVCGGRAPRCRRLSDSR